MANNFLNGNDLMLFVGSSNKVYGYCTSNTFSITRNTEEVSTKSHGQSPATISNGYTWEATTDNLCFYDDAVALRDQFGSNEPVDVIFGRVANTKKGLISEGGDTEAWSVAEAFATGKAILDNLQITADAGGSANYSCTFRGSGAITEIGDPDEAQGAQGNQGNQSNP